MTSVPVRSPQISSCSMAAARKVSAAASRTVLPCARSDVRQLADGGGLADSVDADDENDLGRIGDDLRAALVGATQDGKQFLLEHALEFAGVADLLALHLFAHRGQHFAGGDGAEVGGDERGFQIVEGAGVNLLAEARRHPRGAPARFSRVRVTACFMRSRSDDFFSSG